jgi:secreted PhoX family phosphatase
VLVEGDLARLGRPANIRFSDAGDLFVLEDNSAGDLSRNPAAGGVNNIWVLPRHETGTDNLELCASTPEEPTGPWFSPDNKLLYLSIQSDTFPGRIIAIRHPGNYNQPYDR